MSRCRPTPAVYPQTRAGRPRTPAHRPDTSAEARWRESSQPCSRWGLPSRTGHPARWWSLTPPFHPYPESRPEGRPFVAVCFLWHCPSGSRRVAVDNHPALWSPDFPRRTDRHAGRPDAVARPTRPGRTVPVTCSRVTPLAASVLGVVLLLGTLAFAIVQPEGPPGGAVAAVPAAGIALATGLISWDDAGDPPSAAWGRPSVSWPPVLIIAHLCEVDRGVPLARRVDGRAQPGRPGPAPGARLRRGLAHHGRVESGRHRRPADSGHSGHHSAAAGEAGPPSSTPPRTCPTPLRWRYLFRT